MAMMITVVARGFIESRFTSRNFGYLNKSFHLQLLLSLSSGSTECVLQQIVNELLGRYNKRLDSDQMTSLLAKRSSENPLWLSIACEELRIFGQFRELSDKINHLADGLLEYVSG